MNLILCPVKSSHLLIAIKDFARRAFISIEKPQIITLLSRWEKVMEDWNTPSLFSPSPLLPITPKHLTLYLHFPLKSIYFDLQIHAVADS